MALAENICMGGITRYANSTNSTECPVQKGPGRSKRVQDGAGGSRKFQEAPGGSRRVREGPRGSKRFQEGPATVRCTTAVRVPDSTQLNIARTKGCLVILGKQSQHM